MWPPPETIKTFGPHHLTVNHVLVRLYESTSQDPGTPPIQSTKIKYDPKLDDVLWPEDYLP